ncbi:MAG: HAD family hydrolase [Bdellovibrionaceae bacterium]|nr:HAD family hydrolase [Pseudobdellovibrionaceae bacterium]
MSKYDNLLNKIIQNISLNSHPGRHFHCVFDLDSTLFNVTSRTEKILEDMILEKDFKLKFPTEVKKLDNLLVNHDDWGIKDVLERSGVDNPDFYKKARSFWAHRFFSNEYLKFDRPYLGAVDFVNELSDLGAQITYLTGRDQVRMMIGTIESLKQWKFPIDLKNTHLALKPHFKDEDTDFKSDYLKNINSHHEKIYFFENEPVIIHKVKQQLPEIIVVFMDSVHSGRADPLDHWPKIKMSFLK